MLSLERMRAIAHDLGLEGEQLAPLRGAGGSWLLHIQPVTFSTANAGEGELSAIAFGRLVGAENEPQLMERWSFTNIRIPAFLRVTKVAGAEAPIFVVEFIVKRNSDTVYATTLEVKGSKPSAETSFANVIFGTDLFNPITLDRGQQFSMEARISVSSKIEAGGAMSIGLSQEQRTAAGAAIAVDGTMAYNSQTLSGQRVL